MATSGLIPTWCAGEVSAQLAADYSTFSRKAFWATYHYHAGISLYRSNVAQRGGEVLEIGCGPGWLTIVMHQLCKNAVYWASDSSPEMLRVAESNAESAGIDDIQYCQTAAEALEFDDESFDLVTSLSVLRQLQDKGAAFREAARVLRPGGLAYFSDLLGGMDEATQDAIVNVAPGEYGPEFVRAAVDSALTLDEIKNAARESEVPNWDILVGGLGGSSFMSREVVEWCKSGFPLRELRSSSTASEWNRRISDHSVHIFLRK